MKVLQRYRKFPWFWAWVTGLILRLVLPWFSHGFRFMDEHWQIMEPANGLVHGVWSRTVEWQDGLRCWFYPGFVSLLIRLSETVGIKDPIHITSFVRMIHGLINSFAIPLTYLAIVQFLHSSNSKSKLREMPFALAGAWFIALWPYAIYCSIHTHGEMLGALFVLLGALLPSLIHREALGYCVSGACFGVALLLKVDVAVAGLGYGVYQLLTGRVRRALWLTIGVAPLVLMMGLIDKLTWGIWFQNVIGHARVNLVEHVGDQWGVSPWYTHIVYYIDMLGLPALLGLLLVVPSWKKLEPAHKATWFMNAFFVTVFCAVPHKEKRFVAPVLYSGAAATFATMALAFPRLREFLAKYMRDLISRRNQDKTFRGLELAAIGIVLVHALANTVTYILKQPWNDRIQAIRKASTAPGIEKFISPQWPAVFYFSRHIPSEISEDNPQAIAEKAKGLKRFSIAADWVNADHLKKVGIECDIWPTISGPPNLRLFIPKAFLCDNKGQPFKSSTE